MFNLNRRYSPQGGNRRRRPRRRFDIKRLLGIDHGRLMPVGKMIICHILALGIALVIFALPHHVLPGKATKVEVKRPTDSVVQPTAEPTTDTATATDTAATTDTATATDTATVTDTATTADTVSAETTASQGDPLVPESYSWWSDKFTDTPYQEGNLYVGRNVRVEVQAVYEETKQYFVADVYVRNITHLVGVFANDAMGKGQREHITSASERTGSIVMINGDYYSNKDYAITARNGVLYRNEAGAEGEVCILYTDGTMKTCKAEEIDAEQEMANGAYHIWNFGPGLVNEDGTARTDFTGYNYIGGNNPRTAIGYIEPGHYLLVVIDGRITNIPGTKLPGLAEFMVSYGCKAAFNLDGGQTSMMTLGSTVINTAYDGGRRCSDYIAVID